MVTRKRTITDQGEMGVVQLKRIILNFGESKAEAMITTPNSIFSLWLALETIGKQ